MFLLILLPKELCWLGASGQKKVDPLAKLPKWVLNFTCLKQLPLSIICFVFSKTSKQKDGNGIGWICLLRKGNISWDLGSTRD